MNDVFVYGTLKSGHYNHRVMQIGGTSKKVEGLDCFIRGTMFDLGPFPAVVAEGDNPIAGELWMVDDETLARMDHLEGHPTHYFRKEVELIGIPGKQVFAYFMPKDRLPAKATKMKVGNWPKKY